MGKRVATTNVRADPRIRSARQRLGLAVAIVGGGSFLPWMDTSYGAMAGGLGGVWTFAGAVVGLVGVLLAGARPREGAVLAIVLAAVATLVPLWRVLQVSGLLGLGGWLPGPGLVLVFGGGVLAATSAVSLLVPTRPVGSDQLPAAD